MPVTLTFETAGEVTIDLPVGPIGAPARRSDGGLIAAGGHQRSAAPAVREQPFGRLTGAASRSAALPVRGRPIGARFADRSTGAILTVSEFRWGR